MLWHPVLNRCGVWKLPDVGLLSCVRSSGRSLRTDSLEYGPDSRVMVLFSPDYGKVRLMHDSEGQITWPIFSPQIHQSFW